MQKYIKGSDINSYLDISGPDNFIKIDDIIRWLTKEALIELLNSVKIYTQDEIDKL